MDTPGDLIYLQKIVQQFDGDKEKLSLYDILAIINKDTTLRPLDSIRNEGFEVSLRNENMNNHNFSSSQKMLENALRTIPLGSQTFSKSHIQYPKNTTPLFLTHGLGKSPSSTWMETNI